MQVEIWSDVQCPFCYIGKRKFEAGLAAFEGKENVQIIWRSFQLNPDFKAQPGKDIYTYLAEMKGMSREQSVQMHQQVAAMASEAGLNYDFDKTIPANSYAAHRLIQFAKTQGLGDAAEERLFRAYFTDGADISDAATLARLGGEISMDAAAVKAMLAGDAYAEKVEDDIEEAQTLGIRGVPFFVIDRKYAVSGAQPAEAFLNALQQAQQEAIQATTSDEVCTPDGNCA